MKNSCGSKLCRPIFSYDEIESLMWAMENSKELTGEMDKKLYAKLMRCRNKMDEKAFAEGNDYEIDE